MDGPVAYRSASGRLWGAVPTAPTRRWFPNPNRRQQDLRNNEPALPFLPEQRSPSLTLNPSREAPIIGVELVLSENVASASPFFSKLPPEVRRFVVMEAFGDRTLHMDLRLAYPPLPTAVTYHLSREHGGGTAPLSWNIDRDLLVPKTWRWWSSECHRMLPPWSARVRQARARGEVIPYRYPTDDACLRGETHFCDQWSSDRLSGSCGVGVMGWLLSCRQA
jgi:hypothetical protein